MSVVGSDTGAVRMAAEIPANATPMLRSLRKKRGGCVDAIIPGMSPKKTGKNNGVNT